MKRYLLLLFSLVFVQTTIYAQKIHFTDTTNFWYCMGEDSNGSSFWTYYTYIGEEVLGGNTYHMLRSTTSAPIAYVNGIDFIREDTAAGIVYSFDQSSGYERVLYRYNLHVGDTIHSTYRMFPTVPPSIDAIVDSVISIDSILIRGAYHKVFSLLEIDTSNSVYPRYNPYLTYIEGIGSVFDPVNAHYVAMYNGDTVFLQCFMSPYGGTAPSINLPFTYLAPGNTRTFINNCASVEVPAAFREQKNVQVQPNPVDKSTVIVFPLNIVSGTITVCNSIGQIVINLPIKNADRLLIGDVIKATGLYFYKIVDNRSAGIVYTGKFLKQ